ncbi:hypothetical protein Plhal304r1_c046g0127351 [Plasmopara halstedii]
MRIAEKYQTLLLQCRKRLCFISAIDIVVIVQKLGSACNFMLHEGRSRRFTVFQITCFTTAV